MEKEEIEKELHKKSKDELIKYLLEDVDRIQHLEQKSETLDKVTEECKKQMKEYEDSILEIFPQKILNIIEGEKNENTKDIKKE